jgi:hypothetical protein
MERLDQGHLHPKLEVPRLKCLCRVSAVGSKHSSKELFEQCINSFSEHLHMSLREGVKNRGEESAEECDKNKKVAECSLEMHEEKLQVCQKSLPR